MCDVASSPRSIMKNKTTQGDANSHSLTSHANSVPQPIQEKLKSESKSSRPTKTIAPEHSIPERSSASTHQGGRSQMARQLMIMELRKQKRDGYYNKTSIKSEKQEPTSPPQSIGVKSVQKSMNVTEKSRDEGAMMMLKKMNNFEYEKSTSPAKTKSIKAPSIAEKKQPLIKQVTIAKETTIIAPSRHNSSDITSKIISEVGPGLGPKKKVVYCLGQEMNEVAEYAKKQSDNEIMRDQLRMLPMPERGMRNEKFIYFYRPYSFQVNTNKYMKFDDTEDKNEIEKPKTDLFEYVKLMEERNKRKERTERQRLNSLALQQLQDIKTGFKSSGAVKRVKTADSKSPETEDSKLWQREEILMPEGYISGWKAIQKFLLKDDPRVAKFVLDQLKYRDHRVKLKKPKLLHQFTQRPDFSGQITMKPIQKGSKTQILDKAQALVNKVGDSYRSLISSKKQNSSNSASLKRQNCRRITIQDKTIPKLIQFRDIGEGDGSSTSSFNEDESSSSDSFKQDIHSNDSSQKKEIPTHMSSECTSLRPRVTEELYKYQDDTIAEVSEEVSQSVSIAQTSQPEVCIHSKTLPDYAKMKSGIKFNKKLEQFEKELLVRPEDGPQSSIKNDNDFFLEMAESFGSSIFESRSDLRSNEDLVALKELEQLEIGKHKTQQQPLQRMNAFRFQPRRKRRLEKALTIDPDILTSRQDSSDVPCSPSLFGYVKNEDSELNEKQKAFLDSTEVKIDFSKSKNNSKNSSLLLKSFVQPMAKKRTQMLRKNIVRMNTFNLKNPITQQGGSSRQMLNQALIQNRQRSFRIDTKTSQPSTKKEKQTPSALTERSQMIDDSVNQSGPSDSGKQNTKQEMMSAQAFLKKRANTLQSAQFKKLATILERQGTNKGIEELTSKSVSSKSKSSIMTEKAQGSSLQHLSKGSDYDKVTIRDKDLSLIKFMQTVGDHDKLVNSQSTSILPSQIEPKLIPTITIPNRKKATLRVYLQQKKSTHDIVTKEDIEFVKAAGINLEMLKISDSSEEKFDISQQQKELDFDILITDNQSSNGKLAKQQSAISKEEQQLPIYNKSTEITDMLKSMSRATRARRGVIKVAQVQFQEEKVVEKKQESRGSKSIKLEKTETLSPRQPIVATRLVRPSVTQESPRAKLISETPTFMVHIKDIAFAKRGSDDNIKPSIPIPTLMKSQLALKDARNMNVETAIDFVKNFTTEKQTDLSTERATKRKGDVISPTRICFSETRPATSPQPSGQASKIDQYNMRNKRILTSCKTNNNRVKSWGQYENLKTDSPRQVRDCLNKFDRIENSSKDSALNQLVQVSKHMHNRRLVSYQPVINSNRSVELKRRSKNERLVDSHDNSINQVQITNSACYTQRSRNSKGGSTTNRESTTDQLAVSKNTNGTNAAIAALLNMQADNGKNFIVSINQHIQKRQHRRNLQINDRYGQSSMTSNEATGVTSQTVSDIRKEDISSQGHTLLSQPVTMPTSDAIKTFMQVPLNDQMVQNSRILATSLTRHSSKKYAQITELISQSTTFEKGSHFLRRSQVNQPKLKYDFEDKSKLQGRSSQVFMNHHKPQRQNLF